MAKDLRSLWIIVDNLRQHSIVWEDGITEYGCRSTAVESSCRLAVFDVVELKAEIYIPYQDQILLVFRFLAFVTDSQ